MKRKATNLSAQAPESPSALPAPASSLLGLPEPIMSLIIAHLSNTQQYAMRGVCRQLRTCMDSLAGSAGTPNPLLGSLRLTLPAHEHLYPLQLSSHQQRLLSAARTLVVKLQPAAAGVPSPDSGWGPSNSSSNAGASGPQATTSLTQPSGPSVRRASGGGRALVRGGRSTAPQGRQAGRGRGQSTSRAAQAGRAVAAPVLAGEQHQACGVSALLLPARPRLVSLQLDHQLRLPARQLQLSGCFNLHSLQLCQLDGWGTGTEGPLSTLLPLTRLSRVSLVGVGPSDLMVMSRLTGLTHLTLTEAPYDVTYHMNNLLRLTSLKSLSLADCSVTCANGLEEALPGWQHLRLDNVTVHPHCTRLLSTRLTTLAVDGDDSAQPWVFRSLSSQEPGTGLRLLRVSNLPLSTPYLSSLHALCVYGVPHPFFGTFPAPAHMSSLRHLHMVPSYPPTLTIASHSDSQDGDQTRSVLGVPVQALPPSLHSLSLTAWHSHPSLYANTVQRSWRTCFSKRFPAGLDCGLGVGTNQAQPQVALDSLLHDLQLQLPQLRRLVLQAWTTCLTTTTSPTRRGSQKQLQAQPHDQTASANTASANTATAHTTTAKTATTNTATASTPELHPEATPAAFTQQRLDDGASTSSLLPPSGAPAAVLTAASQQQQQEQQQPTLRSAWLVFGHTSTNLLSCLPSMPQLRQLTRLVLLSLGGFDWPAAAAAARGVAALSQLPVLRDLQLGCLRLPSQVEGVMRQAASFPALLHLVIRLHPDNSNGPGQQAVTASARAELLTAQAKRDVHGTMVAVLGLEDDAGDAWPPEPACSDGEGQDLDWDVWPDACRL